MPAESRIDAAVTPFVLSEKVQQRRPFAAIDWKLTIPCSPMPASRAPRTGCIVARAVPAPIAAAAARATTRAFVCIEPPRAELSSRASPRPVAVPFRSSYKPLNSAMRAALAEDERRLDQREVRERLRKVAELAPGDGVVLLGEEADVVAQVEQTLEELAGFLVAPLERQHGGEPERTRKEDAFAAGEAVD